MYIYIYIHTHTHTCTHYMILYNAMHIMSIVCIICVCAHIICYIILQATCKAARQWVLSRPRARMVSVWVHVGGR